MDEQLIKVGVTHGDINGVGYEVILKTFEDTRITELCTPVIYGSSKVAAYHRKAMELPSVNFSIIASADEAGANRVNIINCIEDNTKVELRKSTAEAGRAAFQSLEAAVADLRRGAIDVLLTAPINKHNIQNETFHFPGHTEYLEQCFAESGQSKALMILLTDSLRVALVTGHVPVSRIADSITVPNIVGKEEEEIIQPAMEEAERKGILSFGPYPADGFFGSRMYEKFDGVLAMYHDQGLAPFKALAMDQGVNFTAGLPIVRTSPDHGTAYDIAGQNKASEVSFRQALYTALDIYRNRKRYQEATARPLRRQYYEKGSEEKLDLTKEE